MAPASSRPNTQGKDNGQPSISGSLLGRLSSLDTRSDASPIQRHPNMLSRSSFAEIAPIRTKRNDHVPESQSPDRARCRTPTANPRRRRQYANEPPDWVCTTVDRTSVDRHRGENWGSFPTEYRLRPFTLRPRIEFRPAALINNGSLIVLTLIQRRFAEDAHQQLTILSRHVRSAVGRSPAFDA